MSAIFQRASRHTVRRRLRRRDHMQATLPCVAAAAAATVSLLFATPGAQAAYIAHAAIVGGPTRAAAATGATREGASSGGGVTGFIPNDPGNSAVAGGWRQMQWNFDGPFGVNAPEAWKHLRADGHPGGSGVIVAVLDTGVAYADDGRFLRSPDFRRSEFVKGYDFVSHSPYPNDRNGHGTFVAGTIAEATNNGESLTGLAYGVRIMPVRVLDGRGEGDASTIARGVRFAVNHGAQVINLSLEFSRGVGAADIPHLISALAYAHRHGVVLVAAAGNEGSQHVPFPARDPYVISVGASTEHGCLANYTNYGRRVDIVAPGGGGDKRLQGDPNCDPGAQRGRDIFQETFLGASPRVFGLPGGYEGTSMACPEVSATAALVIASGVLGPHPAPVAVRQRLEQTATALGDPADATDYGHGLLNAGAATAPGSPGGAGANAEAEQPATQPSASQVRRARRRTSRSAVRGGRVAASRRRHRRRLADGAGYHRDRLRHGPRASSGATAGGTRAPGG